MDMGSLLNLQGKMFLLVAIGVVLRKRGTLPEQGKNILTDLVLGVVLPCNIINSFRMEFSLDILKRFMVIIMVACGIQVVCMIMANTLYNGYHGKMKKVLQYATVVSNAGFMGNPIAEGVFGAEGLMFASVYLIPQRIVMWSAGLSYFTESSSKKALVKKVATHPCIVAVYVGLILLITQLSLPEFLGSTIRSVGNCTTPLSMILIGTILAEVDVKSIMSRTVLAYTGIRLVIIPLIALIGCRLFHVDGLITGVSVLLAGMPAGSSTAILAAKYDGDYKFATKCVVVSTVLSLVTIPLWCMVL